MSTVTTIEAARGALAALTQPATFPADVELARRNLGLAIAGAERAELELAELRRLLGTIAPHAETFAQDWRSGLEDGTYEERAGLVYLERALERWDELEKGAAPAPSPAPVYVIGVEGGIVQGMSTNNIHADMPRIIVCDWDTQGDEGLEIGDSRANVFEPGAVLEVDFVDKVLAAIDEADKAEAQAESDRQAEAEGTLGY